VSNSIEMDVDAGKEHGLAVQPKVGVVPWVIVAVLLASVFLMDNSRVVTGAQAPIWDAWAFYGSEFTLVADHARVGRLLLWDPWIAGGTPDFAEPQVGAASPVTVLTGAIFGGTLVGFCAYWLLIWFLGPLGLLLLARHLGSPPWAAFVLSLGYAFCGFYTGHAEHTSFVYSFSFLPLLVWRLDTALLSGRLMPAFEAGGLWGLSALGGYPELTILSGGFLGLWTLGRCCFQSVNSEEGTIGRRLRFAGLTMVVAFCIGLVVLAPSYFAFFTQGSGYTDRVGVLSREYAISSNELDPGSLTTFASPYLHLLKYPGLNPTLWPKTDISAMGIYIGALPLILALLAIVQSPKEAWRWWLVAVGVLELACAMGDHLPIRGWLYDYCPLTRYFRHPGTFRGYAIFIAMVLAILAGKNLHSACTQSSSRIWKQFFFASLGVAAAALLSYRYVISHVSNLPDGLHRANRQVLLVWLSCVVISLLFSTLPRTRAWLPFLFCVVAMIDASLTIRISQPLVSESSFFGPMWKRIDSKHNPDLRLKSLQRDLRPPDWLTNAPNNNSIPLKLPTLFNDSSMANRFHNDFAKHPLLLDMSLGSDRIWFSNEVATVTPSDATYTAFVQRTEQIGVPVVVVHPREEMRRMYQKGRAAPSDGTEVSAVSRLPVAHKIAVQLQRYTPNHLDFQVVCPEDGWLLVTDRWSPTWQAKVNGKPAEVFGGDFIFRAIRVSQGENTIEFSYRPILYLVLLTISWGTLMAVLVGPQAAKHWPWHRQSLAE
jgi:hypothetical protein